MNKIVLGIHFINYFNKKIRKAIILIVIVSQLAFSIITFSATTGVSDNTNTISISYQYYDILRNIGTSYKESADIDAHKYLFFANYWISRYFDFSFQWERFKANLYYNEIESIDIWEGNLRKETLDIGLKYKNNSLCCLIRTGINNEEISINKFFIEKKSKKINYSYTMIYSIYRPYFKIVTKDFNLLADSLIKNYQHIFNLNYNLSDSININTTLNLHFFYHNSNGNNDFFINGGIIAPEFTLKHLFINNSTLSYFFTLYSFTGGLDFNEFYIRYQNNNDFVKMTFDSVIYHIGFKWENFYHFGLEYKYCYTSSDAYFEIRPEEGWGFASLIGMIEIPINSHYASIFYKNTVFKKLLFSFSIGAILINTDKIVERDNIAILFIGSDEARTSYVNIKRIIIYKLGLEFAYRFAQFKIGYSFNQIIPQIIEKTIAGEEGSTEVPDTGTGNQDKYYGGGHHVIWIKYYF